MINLRQETSPNSTLRLQHAIHEFKKKQLDKSAIENKLHILKQKCQTNHKKAKNIKTQISKINSIKHTFQKEKIQIQQQLAGQQQKHARKVQRERTYRQQTKENMHIIRNLIQQDKREEYHKIKERTNINQMKITQNLKKSLHLNTQKSLEVKLQEESSRLNRTIYLEKKRILAHSRSEVELQPLKIGTERTNEYIRHMKLLERQMTEKLKISRQSLSNSKISLNNTLR